MQRDGMWIAITDVTPALDGERVELRSVRYRTVGDMSCTAAVLSKASTVHDVITEVGLSALTERGATGPTTGSPRQPWKIASGKATNGHRHVHQPCHGSAWTPAAAARHGRLGRRRQIHAGRAAAVRHQLGADRHPRPRRAGEQAQGLDRTDLALLTDGLRAEREQGITIDVAYRYFATPARKFILADCPGHVQYTRNTVTGSSTADVIVLLVDARNGVVEQTRRHLAVASLLRVPHVILVVNKIDLVGYSEDVFNRSPPTSRCSPELGVRDTHCIPCRPPRVTTSWSARGAHRGTTGRRCWDISSR